MGIDAHLFARRAKLCFYFDRECHLLRLTMWEDDREVAGVDHDAVEQVSQLLHDGGYPCAAGGATASQVLYLCDQLDALAAAGIEVGGCGAPEEHVPYWTSAARRFVALAGEDLYFVRNDYQEPDAADVRRAGGYSTWEPETGKVTREDERR